MSMLSVRNLSISFGGLLAVNEVSFDVEPGEVFTIVGPNGAGKSTIFNLISSFYTPTEGTIEFEDIELFDHSTVLHNLLVGRHVLRQTNLIEELLFLPRARRAESQHRQAVEAVIDFLELEAYRDKIIAGLPYGVRKVVEIGRALALTPRLLLLDEPASGLSVEETQDVAFWIEDMKSEMGLTILMVEHDMNLVAQVSDRVLAMADGRMLAMGTPAEVQADAGVIAAYLGEEDAA